MTVSIIEQKAKRVLKEERKLAEDGDGDGDDGGDDGDDGDGSFSLGEALLCARHG